MANKTSPRNNKKKNIRHNTKVMFQLYSEKGNVLSVVTAPARSYHSTMRTLPHSYPRLHLLSVWAKNAVTNDAHVIHNGLLRKNIKHTPEVSVQKVISAQKVGAR